MFKLILGGIVGFIVIGLIGLNGVAKFKIEQDAGEGVTEIVALYKVSKLDAKKQMARGMKICLKNIAKGKVPSYVHKFFVDGFMTTVHFLAKNGKISLSDDKYKEHKKTILPVLLKQVRILDRRLLRENRKTQKRIDSIFVQIQRDDKLLATCIGRNYLHRLKRKNKLNRA